MTIVLSLLLMFVGLYCSAFPADEGMESAVCDVNDGYWVPQMSFQCGQAPQSSFAYCYSRGWTWPATYQRLCGWKRITKLDSFDKNIFLGSEQQPIRALARLDNPSVAYTDKTPSIEFAKGKIVRYPKAADIPEGAITPKTVVWCQDVSTFSYCDHLKTGVGLLVAGNDDSFAVSSKAVVVDAGRIKATAAKADKYENDEYRDVVYDVIIQVGLNAAAKSLKKPIKASPPPPGGIAYNPVLGAIFIGVAIIALFLMDGYLGLVAIVSKVLRIEGNVSWESAIEKVHASIPGIHDTPVAKPDEKAQTTAKKSIEEESRTDDDAEKLISRNGH
jgi:hypothetical protein